MKKKDPRRLLPAANAARRKSGRLGGRPKRTTSAAGWDIEAIRKMARRGNEAGDIEIVAGLDLSDPTRRSEFERIVEEGHAHHRVKLADRSYLDAVERGKTTALKESLAAWIPRYADDTASSWAAEIAGAKERFQSMIDKLKEHKKKLKGQTDAI